jgi:hypothetical protein
LFPLESATDQTVGGSEGLTVFGIAASAMTISSGGTNPLVGRRVD